MESVGRHTHAKPTTGKAGRKGFTHGAALVTTTAYVCTGTLTLVRHDTPVCMHGLNTLLPEGIWSPPGHAGLLGLAYTKTKIVLVGRQDATLVHLMAGAPLGLSHHSLDDFFESTIGGHAMLTMILDSLTYKIRVR